MVFHVEQPVCRVLVIAAVDTGLAAHIARLLGNVELTADAVAAGDADAVRIVAVRGDAGAVRQRLCLVFVLVAVAAGVVMVFRIVREAVFGHGVVFIRLKIFTVVFFPQVVLKIGVVLADAVVAVIERRSQRGTAVGAAQLTLTLAGIAQRNIVEAHTAVDAEVIFIFGVVGHMDSVQWPPSLSMQSRHLPQSSQKSPISARQPPQPGQCVSIQQSASVHSVLHAPQLHMYSSQ